MADKPNSELPNSAAALIALARVAHRNGERQIESAAKDKLTREFGIELHFPCSDSVDRDLQQGG